VTGGERLLAACAGQAVDATPVWFMRQAGGSLPGYLALRERHGVEEIARTPDLCAQVSLMPVDGYGVDGAVMFADILLPLRAMGIDFQLRDDGPHIDRPIRSADDIRRLRPLDPEADVADILSAIRMVAAEAGERAATIGIVGAPFTIASYLIEGGPSRDPIRTRALLHREPATWAALMRPLAEAMAAYARAQVRAGASVVVVFDSWAGCLSPEAYRCDVAPWTTRVVDAIAAAGARSIHQVIGSAGILDVVAAVPADVVGIDSRQSLAAARGRLGPHRAVQGNLDPALLLADWEAVAAGARRVLREGGGRGHLFNLGHAAPRDTDPGLLRDLTAWVHEQKAAAAA
jgi:uroporphyrinogen decarboxylase